MNNSSNNESECIICMDNTKELLISNSYCECKIKWHNSCWDKYLKSTNSPKCPTCRKPLNELLQYLLPRPTAPLRLSDNLQIVQGNITQQIEHITLTLQSLQQVVQERLDEINLEQQQHQHQQSPENKKKRQLQALLLIFILIGISIGIYKIVI